MRYLKMGFTCQMLTPGVFSAYKGSMLRGALGFNLRKALCVSSANASRNNSGSNFINDCSVCILGASCIFSRVFCPTPAPEKAGISPLLAPPFCIEPLDGDKTSYAVGEKFLFNLKLFSFATDYLPFFVHAFMLAGCHGVGQREPPGKFMIIDIRHEDKPVYDADARRLLPCRPKDLPMPYLLPDTGEMTLDIHLSTPLRFKVASHFSSSLDFTAFINLIVRRLKTLQTLDGVPPGLQCGEHWRLKSLASSVQTVGSSLAWRDWSRYSSRQQVRMRLGGLMGKITYCGSMGSFKKYIDFASEVHIGKQTSFGLGAIAPVYSG